MKLTHHELQIELLDAWWTEAGMGGFVPTSKAYRTDGGCSTQEVSISDIGPVIRCNGVGTFRKDIDNEIPARERVLKILRGFRQGSAIPPVEVEEWKYSSTHRYKLTNGTHRLYCSLAAGFTHVPAVVNPRRSE